MAENFDARLQAFVNEYCENVKKGFLERWETVTPKIYNSESTDTIGCLGARQATLAIELARSPGIWNGHIAPLILRCMTDAHITLAWIVDSPEDRSKEYIRYGLGQEKLFIEYLENEPREEAGSVVDDQIDQLIEVRKDWLNAQLAEWAIEVNVGSWSGKSTRDMAKEADCESLYKFAYVPFSGVAHNMWQHVGIYNAETCVNPLHKYHRLPRIEPVRLDPDYLYRASKYVSRTYELLDKKLGTSSSRPLPVDFFADHEFFNGVGDDQDG